MNNDSHMASESEDNIPTTPEPHQIFLDASPEPMESDPVARPSTATAPDRVADFLLSLRSDPEERDKTPTAAELEDSDLQDLLFITSNPKRMCYLLNVKRDENDNPPTTLPVIKSSAKSALADREVLEKATRLVQSLTDAQLVELTEHFNMQRDTQKIIKAFIQETRCTSPAELAVVIDELQSLVDTTVRKSFRMDRILNMSPEDIAHAATVIDSLADKNYCDRDWHYVWESFPNRQGMKRIVDSSNHTLSESLKSYAEDYKGQIISNTWQIHDKPEEHRTSDSKFQKGFAVADDPDYEKIYQTLSALSDFRTPSNNSMPTDMDCTVILSIVQEMQDLIATEFDPLATQMAVIAQNVNDSPNLFTMVRKFTESEITDLEHNPYQLPDDFKNVYDLRLKQKEKLEAHGGPETMPPKSSQ